MWIYEHQDWPEFSWDSQVIALKLADLRYNQGLLLGRMENLGFNLKLEASLNTITSDVVKSSAIEGEILNPEEVRSSVARKLGIEIGGLTHVSRDVEGIVEVMLDATQNFLSPLTKERLFNWHAALFPTGRSGMYPITVGGWRTLKSGAMQVVSGAIGKEVVHFEAPSAEKLDKEMTAFLTWFNNSNNIDPVIRAGIAHLWFVTIHPFEDGNGRIARAIGDMALAYADGTSERFYSLSSQISAERKSYYTQLERQQRSTPEITNWLLWFLDCLESAISGADLIIGKVIFKSRLWGVVNQKPINDRQRLIINRMLEDSFEGHMNTSKYAKIAKCSNDTALRDIQTLSEWGVLIKNPGSGRSTSYRLVEKIEE